MFFNSDGTLVFANTTNDQQVIWPAILEKAWAKVVGNYAKASGGVIVNSVRALTGIPIFQYKTSLITNITTVFALLTAADQANYILVASTPSSSTNSLSSCGLATGHSFSILTVFTMTDASGVNYQALLIREPRGTVP